MKKFLFCQIGIAATVMALSGCQSQNGMRTGSASAGWGSGNSMARVNATNGTQSFNASGGVVTGQNTVVPAGATMGGGVQTGTTGFSAGAGLQTSNTGFSAGAGFNNGVSPAGFNASAGMARTPAQPMGGSANFGASGMTQMAAPGNGLPNTSGAVPMSALPPAGMPMNNVPPAMPSGFPAGMNGPGN
jgi:hypothetical protein